jgi:hypothetical protein
MSVRATRTKKPLMSIVVLVSLLLTLILMLSTANQAIDAAYPEGPTITINNRTRRTMGDSTAGNASAGNVTQMTFQGSGVTQTWQGYYGNLTGQIRLDNAANQAMYTWRLPYPSGEIYVSEIQTVNWTSNNLRCYHFHNEPSAAGAYLDIWEYEMNSTAPPYAGLGLNVQSVDGVDETFTNQSNAPGYSNFYTGTKFWNGTGGLSAGSPACPRTWIYNNNQQGGWRGTQYNATNFTEIMIWGNWHNGANNGRPIYVGFIKQYGAPGFNGKNWNYELMVPDNGHKGNTAPTTYYFYVELE